MVCDDAECASIVQSALRAMSLPCISRSFLVTEQEAAGSSREQGLPRLIQDAAQVLHDGLVELCAASGRHAADEHDVAAQLWVHRFYASAQTCSPLNAPEDPAVAIIP